MINPNELMIGNYVTYLYCEEGQEKIHQIKSISDDGDICLGIITPFGVHAEDVENIVVDGVGINTITSECDDHDCKGSLIGIVIRLVCIDVCQDFEAKILWDINYENYESTVRFIYNFIGTGRYSRLSLHQIQNAFYSIFGVEFKKIKIK